MTSYVLYFDLTAVGGATTIGSLKFTTQCSASGVVVSTSSTFPTSVASGVDIYAYIENIPSEILPGYDFTGTFQTDSTDCPVTSVVAYSDSGATTPVTQLTWNPSTNKI